MNRRVAVVVLASGGLLPPFVFAEGKKNPVAPAHRSAPAGHLANNSQNQSRGIRAGSDPHPGERALERLESMSPEQRARALRNLPPQRRQGLEQKLNGLDAMNPAERTRLRGQLERLNNLPTQKQNQIRRSMQQFQALPDDRKALVKRELDRMNSMAGDERASSMKGGDFHSRFTPHERQMIQNLSEIMPENSGKRN